MIGWVANYLKMPIQIEKEDLVPVVSLKELKKQCKILSKETNRSVFQNKGEQESYVIALNDILEWAKKEAKK